MLSRVLSGKLEVNHECEMAYELLRFTKACVLVNGIPTSEFSIKRGLRQGDLLSPFLFIHVMKGLHCALSTVVSSNLIHGINLGSLDLTLSYLFYADDVIVTTEWNPDDLDNIIRVLHVSNMVRNSRCAAGSFPFTYLGLLIGYTMNRGLNISSLKSFNLALLQKWRWRRFSFPNALWVKVIKAIHGQEGGFDTYGCKFNGIWARIVGSSNILHSNNIIPLNSFRFKVGLYRLEQDKDCLIIDLIENGKWSWNWSRNDLGVHDIFPVKEARRVIDDNILPSLVTSTSWDKTLPRKVNIFIWRFMLDRLPHRLNLSSRGHMGCNWADWLKSPLLIAGSGRR
ncbi:RNA-directed DNA polymerase, eukaryota, reverse transcriptase zinc-binding domain protein [Tanacetum coccineum]